MALVGAGGRFLITGGAGFIGSHLTELLLSEGHEVVVLDALSTGQLANLGSVQDHPELRFVQGSVLDELVVDELVHECDVVVHLAAVVGVRLVVEQPLRSFITNIRGTENVITAAHRYKRKLLVASSSEIYGKNGHGPLSELSDRIVGPPTVSRWAYATAKAVDEVLALAYNRERGLPTVVVRLFNTVGPRQSPAYGMVIPRLVRQALAGDALTVYGSGNQTRCFCHVLDVVPALRSLLDDDRAIGEVFNIGSTEEISIRELAERVIAATGSSSTIRLVPYEEAYSAGFEDMERRLPDTTKINQLIGWAPTRNLSHILEDAITDARQPTPTAAG